MRTFYYNRFPFSLIFTFTSTGYRMEHDRQKNPVTPLTRISGPLISLFFAIATALPSLFKRKFPDAKPGDFLFGIMTQAVGISTVGLEHLRRSESDKMRAAALVYHYTKENHSKIKDLVENNPITQCETEEEVNAAYKESIKILKDLMRTEVDKMVKELNSFIDNIDERDVSFAMTLGSHLNNFHKIVKIYEDAGVQLFEEEPNPEAVSKTLSFLEIK